MPFSGKSAVQIASGYHAVSRTVSGMKDSVRRIGSLFDLLAGNDKANRVKKPPEYKFMVYTPYIHEYGQIVEQNGEKVFQAEGVVSDQHEAPQESVVLKGAYFCGNDFKELIDDVFTPEQQKNMIDGADVKRVIVSVGAITAFVLMVIFVFNGQWVALSAVPVIVLLLALALKFGIYAETLRSKKHLSISEYISKRGPLGMLF